MRTSEEYGGDWYGTLFRRAKLPEGRPMTHCTANASAEPEGKTPIRRRSF